MRYPQCGSKECCGGDMAEDLASLREQLAEAKKDAEQMREFVEEVRRSGDTRLASMAIAVLNGG